jgi:hypothetical protein
MLRASVGVAAKPEIDHIRATLPTARRDSIEEKPPAVTSVTPDHDGPGTFRCNRTADIKREISCHGLADRAANPAGSEHNEVTGQLRIKIGRSDGGVSPCRSRRLIAEPFDGDRYVREIAVSTDE